jgi:rod shape-determining protein MreB
VILGELAQPGGATELARVPPQSVIGVDPPAQDPVGLLGGVVGVVLVRAPDGRLVGWAGHLMRLPTAREEMRSRGQPAVPCAGMSRDLAIDLGTANTLVHAKGKGLVLNEPTVVVLAIGTDAWQMIGRTPGYIVAERPLRGGAITDFEVTERMLSVLLHRVGVSRLNRPKVLICVPSAITAVERRAVKEAARRAGASSAFLIEQPMAAAIGAGLPIHEPVGNMVVDIGGGTAEMAVISLGGVVAVRALRCGGFDFDASIQAYVRHAHGVAIGERTAEAIKHAIGSAFPYPGEQQAEIRGREVATGRPKTVVLTPEEVRGALEENVQQVITAAAYCLGDAPPELAQDIMFQGIHLTGGGALLRGMTQRVADATAVPVHLVDTPLECVVQGAGKCLESFDRLKRLFTQDE